MEKIGFTKMKRFPPLCTTIFGELLKTLNFVRKLR